MLRAQPSQTAQTAVACAMDNSRNESKMSRLADYFVIVGYDHEKERKSNHVGRGMLIYFLLIFFSSFHQIFVLRLPCVQFSNSAIDATRQHDR